MPLIRDKKQVFNDLRIPWNSSIKDEFKKEMSAHPDKDPELVLDKICKPYKAGLIRKIPKEKRYIING